MLERALTLTGSKYNRPGILLQLILHPVPHRRRWPALWPPCAWITIRWKSKTSTPPAIRCWTRGARKPLLGRRMARQAARTNETTGGAVVGRTADEGEKQLRRARKKERRRIISEMSERQIHTRAGAGCEWRPKRVTCLGSFQGFLSCIGIFLDHTCF